MRFCTSFGKAARRLAHRAAEQVDDRFGERQLAVARRATSSRVRSLATRNRAMSPTAFDVGVTFTMSPNSWFTSA